MSIPPTTVQGRGHRRAATPFRALTPQVLARAAAMLDYPFPPTPAPRHHPKPTVVQPGRDMPLTTFTTGDVSMPTGLRRPELVCGDTSVQHHRGGGISFRCTRARDHRGRHASVRWEMAGMVRAVWGTRDQVPAVESEW